MWITGHIAATRRLVIFKLCYTLDLCCQALPDIADYSTVGRAPLCSIRLGLSQLKHARRQGTVVSPITTFTSYDPLYCDVGPVDA